MPRSPASASPSVVGAEISGLWQHRYKLLALIWVVTTSAFFTRVSRQPYAQAIKWEQYETIFKGTTLGAALVGFGMSGSINRRRSEHNASSVRGP